MKPVYWKQKYAGRGQRHRAWVKRQAAREAAARRAPAASPWQRFLALLRRNT